MHPTPSSAASPSTRVGFAERKVLNVGGHDKHIGIPAHYAGWTHHIIDIDPRGAPDIVGDAREVLTHPPAIYDAVYCSHNLEHYLHHEARKVAAGFVHLLKEDGFAEIKVPDIQALMKRAVTEGLDLDDTLYTAPSGPISVRDVMWGYGPELERSGADFYAHKTGFSPRSLTAFLEAAGFEEIFLDGSGPERMEVAAIAFKRRGPSLHKQLFGLS